MPVRVHCEDTSPIGHVRLESLVAYAERIRSLALKQFMGLSLADLKQLKLAILANEYVVEIIGKGCDVMETLQIDTAPEFPGAPLFPWTTEMLSSSGDLYMRGLFGLSLCSISQDGYKATTQEEYKNFTQHWLWSNPAKKKFSEMSLRFFSAYNESGKAFTPTALNKAVYVVRAADCDLYSVLFQARVCSMMESCHRRYDALAMYVNIMTSMRPGDELTVRILSSSNAALFICTVEGNVRLTAFGHYGESWPICREEIKCASTPGHLKKLLTFCTGGEKPSPCKDFDLSNL